MLLIGNKNGIIKQKYLSKTAQVIKNFPTYTIIGGEFAVCNDTDNIALKTLLGSCVAIMFYDNNKKIKAMNHFLLPKTTSSNYDMKYGLFSVESMLNEMYNLGCKKENIVAKISGGASIVNINISTNRIGNRNVDFAIDFCRSEKFDIISNDTKGTKSRVILLANNFDTFIKNINENNENINMINNEIQLQKNISIIKNEIELF
jgi:chemotaxis protein CheD